MRATASPRVAFYLGRWSRATGRYPDFQLRLFDRRLGRCEGALVHESIHVRGHVGRLGGEIEHFPYADVSDHLNTIDRYTTLWARQSLEAGLRAYLARALRHADLGLLPQLRPPRRPAPREGRPDDLGAKQLLHVLEAREAPRADAGPRLALTGRRFFPPSRVAQNLAGLPAGIAINAGAIALRSVCCVLFRPAPLPRTRPYGSGSSCNSRSALWIVGRDKPEVRATAETPPLPNRSASAAATSRHCRSSRCGNSARYFSLNSASTTIHYAADCKICECYFLT